MMLFKLMIGYQKIFTYSSIKPVIFVIVTATIMVMCKLLITFQRYLIVGLLFCFMILTSYSNCLKMLSVITFSNKPLHLHLRFCHSFSRTQVGFLLVCLLPIRFNRKFPVMSSEKIHQGILLANMFSEELKYLCIFGGLKGN